MKDTRRQCISCGCRINDDEDITGDLNHQARHADWEGCSQALEQELRNPLHLDHQRYYRGRVPRHRTLSETDSDQENR